jgi:hypothetical protein
MNSLAMMSRYFRKDRIDGSEVKMGPKDAEDEADIGIVLDDDVSDNPEDEGDGGCCNVATLEGVVECQVVSWLQGKIDIASGQPFKSHAFRQHPVKCSIASSGLTHADAMNAHAGQMRNRDVNWNEALIRAQEDSQKIGANVLLLRSNRSGKQRKKGNVSFARRAAQRTRSSRARKQTANGALRNEEHQKNKIGGGAVNPIVIVEN